MSNHTSSQTNQQSFPSPLGFWFQWLIAAAAGFAIGMAVRQFMFSLGAWAVSPPVIGVIIGTAIGAAQMFNLQQYLTRSGWGWVLASIIGWAISWTTINQYVGYFVLGLGITQFSLVRGLAAGALAGLGQWLIYRQQFKRAGWWIPANAVGWGAGMAVGVAVGGAFGWPLVGAVAGAITGYPLVWMLKPRTATTSNGFDTV